MSKDTYNEEWIEYYQYLEKLRQSGATNMYGATPHLIHEYALRAKEATNVLLSWMTHYDALLEDGVIVR